MYRKVWDIYTEVKNGTAKKNYAMATLDRISQEMLKQGNAEAKRLADNAFALMPLMDEKKQELLDTLDALAHAMSGKNA